MFQALPALTAVTPRTFVIDSCDEIVGSVLKENGWKQIAKNSISWNLKWTWKSTPKELQSLQNGQFINHFKGSDEISTKLGLGLLYKRNPVITDEGKSYLSFYPRSFNLSTEKEDFISNFIQTGILNLLKKIIACLEIFHREQYQDAKQLKKAFKTDKTGQKLLELFDSNTLFTMSSKSSRKDFKINGKLLIRLLFYIENLFSLDESYDFKTEQLLELLEYSKHPIPFPTAQNILAPSTGTLALILAYHEKCLKSINGFYQDGFSNIWVIKSNHSSRGRNISLIDEIRDIETMDNGMKLVQKYVENIWVLHEIGERQREMYPEMTKILKKKFDIRLWVLVRSFTPLVVYIYDEAYLRISSESYKLDTLDEKQSHLTNFSVNWKQKDLKQEKQSSYLLLSQFMRYLREEEGVNVNELKVKINMAIIQTLKLVQIKEDPRCFELFGFDVIIDAGLTPWILECNMSPACSPRGQLKNLVRNMTSGMLSIMGFIDGSPNGWRLICDQKVKSQKQLLTCRALRETGQNFAIRANLMRNTMINWNDSLLSTSKLEWKKYQLIEGCHFYFEKVQFIQKFLKERYKNAGRKGMNGEELELQPFLNYSRVLKLFEALSRIGKRFKKLHFSILRPKRAKKKRAR